MGSDDGDAARSKFGASLSRAEKGFAFCPEFTAKISKLGIKIHEVPISYNGRSYDEGKKIKITDGLRAIYVLLKNIFSS